MLEITLEEGAEKLFKSEVMNLCRKVQIIWMALHNTMHINYQLSKCFHKIKPDRIPNWKSHPQLRSYWQLLTVGGQRVSVLWGCGTWKATTHTPVYFVVIHIQAELSRFTGFSRTKGTSSWWGNVLGRIVEESKGKGRGNGFDKNVLHISRKISSFKK